MSRISRANRQFEFFLFGGVPEGPEGTYERNYNAHALGRLTGHPVGGPPPQVLVGEGEVVGRFRFVPTTGETVFEYLDETVAS